MVLYSSDKHRHLQKGAGLRGLGAGEAGRFEEESMCCGAGPAEEVSAGNVGVVRKP